MAEQNSQKNQEQKPEVKIQEELKTHEQKIAYDILVNIFKKKPEDALKIIKTWSSPITLAWKYGGRPQLERWLQKALAGKIVDPTIPLPPTPDEKKEDYTKYFLIGGGILLGVLTLTLMFKALGEGKK